MTLRAARGEGADRAPLRSLLWTTAAFLGGVLLHVDRVPWWASAVAAGCALWRVAAGLRAVTLPGALLRGALSVILLAAILVLFRTLNGLAAGTALLVAMGAVKLLETHARRDQYVVVGVALFLLLAACLDRQDLLRAPLYALQAWLTCTALMVAAHPRSAFDGRRAALLAGRGLLFALPLALLLFVFVPRLAGSFWALPRGDAALTGLGDSMSPGSISRLTDSDDVAFRVWFAGAPPPPQERYWRGPVLHDFDGFTWRRVRGRFYPAARLKFLGPVYHYRITLQPHQGRWWFALDTVAFSPSPRVFLTPDHELVSLAPLTEPVTYDAVSSTHTRSAGPLSTLARRYDTQLPPGRNPRTRALAVELRTRAGNEAGFVHSVLEMFRTQGFRYTLTPPLLDADSVDDFLFNTRRGFCGHFASAFVALMRAAGVPARVVTGYLGGDWNPIGHYFVVRQSDAHAWAEIWVSGRGWTRVDPTAVVAPERLQRGILDFLPDAVSAPARLIHNTRWLEHIGQGWDALNAWWNNQVIEFDLHSQLTLLGRLGIHAPAWQDLGVALVLAVTGWLGWMALQFGRPPPPLRRERLARAYERLCRKLARSGVVRAAHCGPLDYGDAIAAQRPDVARSARPLLQRYASLRFGAAADPRAIGAFERAVARLRVRRRAGSRPRARA